MDLQNQSQSSRLVALDALRGFVMFWILGSNGQFGGKAIIKGLAKALNIDFLNTVATQLEHNDWQGVHFYDLIMPMFLFVVGAAIPFAFDKRLEQGDSKNRLYLHIIKRTAVLFVLAMIIKGRLLTFDLSQIAFFCDTLQGIAMGYFVASIIYLNCNVRWQILFLLVFLLLYWALLNFVPVPGFGAGNITPDGNLSTYLDKQIMRGFQRGTASRVLGPITCTSTVLIGALAAQLLRSKKSSIVKFSVMVIAGIICLIVGLLWGQSFPLIEKIWTSSFALVAGGFALLMFALFYLIIDICKIQKWAFGFIVIGSNSLAAYIGTRIFFFKPDGGIFTGQWLGVWMPFVQALFSFAIIWLILYWLYKRKVFIKA